MEEVGEVARADQQDLVNHREDLGGCEGKTLKALSESMTHIQKELGNLNRPISTKEIQFTLKTIPTKKIPCLNAFTGEFYQTFREGKK